MRRRRLALLAVPTLASALVLVGVEPAAAVACSTEQVTNTEDIPNGNPHISADGTVVAFTSANDFSSGFTNQDGNVEIWRVDLSGSEPAWSEVTNTNQPTKNVSMFDMDAAGDTFAYRADVNLAGGNPDGSPEIFLVQHPSHATEQITSAAAPDQVNPSIDDAGLQVTFDSNQDLASQNGTNADLNKEVFRYDVAGDDLVLVTNTTNGGSESPVLSGDGTTVSFRSTSTQLGGNVDGSTEAFVYPFGALGVTTLTDTNADSFPTAIDRTGSRVLLSSSADLVLGNSDGNNELFLRDANGQLTQVTQTTGAVNNIGTDLSSNGARLSLDSDADLTGSGSSGTRQVHLRDGAGHLGLFRISRGSQFADQSRLDATGTHVVYRSSGDPVGLNPDGNIEIFLATCGAVSPTYTDVAAGNFFYDAIQWMAEAGVANGFPNGTFKPGDPVKRQQMANFLYNLAGRPAFTPPPTPTFTDVPATNPFFLQVEWMTAEGIANGFPGGLFKPNDPVKRQQMANFLHNLAGQPAFTPPPTPTFTDVPATNPFFLQVEWMTAEGIANGFPGGLFKPNDPVKRQQMAQFLLNLVNGPGVAVE